MMRTTTLAAALIGATAAVGVWAYVTLPPDARIAVHFSADGVATGFMAKGPGLALLPAIGAAVVAILTYAPRLYSRDAGLEASRPALGVVLAGVAGVFLVAEIVIARHAMDPGFDVLRWLFTAIGVLFVVSGNLLGKVRQNSLFGVRTPWTLRDGRVWDKTQRFTGRLMVLGGLMLTGVALLGPSHGVLIGVLVVCAAVPGVAGVIYSAVISRPAAHA